MSFLNTEESTSLDFDTAAEPAKRAFEPIAPGKYRVLCEKAVITSNSAGNGKILKLTLKVQDEPHVGRVVFHNLNIQNQNEQAQQIARSELAGLLASVGLVGERDMAKLVGKEAVAKLAIQPAKGEYDARNVVKAYEAAGGFVPSAAPAAVKQAPGFMSKGPALK